MMLAVKKKRLDEDLDGDDGCAVDPSDITGPQSNVTIRGVVTDISPIKESKRDSRLKYFTGKITDGKKTLRMALLMIPSIIILSTLQTMAS